MSRSHRSVQGGHLAIALAAALLLTGCGRGDVPAAPTGSETPAPLTVYNGRSEELIAPLLEQFTSDTNIPVELRSAASGELAAQLLTEADATPADVFLSQDAGALGALTRAGLFSPLPDDILQRIPAEYRAKDGTWTGLSGRVRVVVYNDEKVSVAPSRIDEVVSGPWGDGKIGYAPTNASWQSFVTGLRVLRGEAEAKKWLESFAAQDPVAFEGNSQVRDAVDAGKIEIGLINHYYRYELVAEKGESEVNVKNQFMAAGDPGGLVNVSGAGVLAASDQAADAQRLIDYMTSAKAQKYFATTTFEYPLIDGITATDGLPALKELAPPALDLSDLESIQQTQDLLAEVGLLTK